MEADIKSKLVYLYNQNSKHSNYQVLASNFKGTLPMPELSTNSRYEQERWDYITSKASLKGMRVLDIGGNTGFFTLESINSGASYVDYYEGNLNHANFVSASADFFGLSKMISVHNEYYSFTKSDICYDLTLLLNVLHHCGDDYGGALSMDTAKKQMLQQLNHMAYHTRFMAFQLGYNWKGNRNLGLFKNGTKREQLEWIQEGTHAYWDILHVGIAVKDLSGVVAYEDAASDNMHRVDALGEFLNRPLFIRKFQEQIEHLVE